MSAVLNTNVASLWASKNLLGAQNTLASSVERLSSGLRINRARDDAAGLGVANSLTAQINGANQGIRNLNDAISMVQTAEGAIAAASQMGQRILMLATQGANGTLGLDERDAILNEMQELLNSIDSIGKRTSFSGNDLLGVATNDWEGPETLYSMQISNASGDNIELESSAFYDIGTGSNNGTRGVDVNIDIGLEEGETFDIQFTGYPKDGNGMPMDFSVTVTAAQNGGGASVSDLIYAFENGSTDRVSISGDIVELRSVWRIDQYGEQGFSLQLRPNANADMDYFIDQVDSFNQGFLTSQYYDPSTGHASNLQESVYGASEILSNLQNQQGGFDLQDLSNSFKDIQDAATQYVIDLGTQRSKLGAYQNQMEYTLSNITELSSNLQSARSRVIDTDYASETANLTKGQILQQAATAMLAQANQMPNVILTLLK